MTTHHFSQLKFTESKGHQTLQQQLCQGIDGLEQDRRFWCIHSVRDTFSNKPVILDLIDPSLNAIEDAVVNGTYVGSQRWIPARIGPIQKNSNQFVFKSQINNLSSNRHLGLHQALEQLFSLMLPEIERMLPISCPSRRAGDMKVIVKCRRFRFAYGNTYQSNIHMEGSADEQIRVVALYFPRIDSSIHGGTLNLLNKADRWGKPKTARIHEDSFIAFCNDNLRHQLVEVACNDPTSIDNKQNDQNETVLTGSQDSDPILGPMLEPSSSPFDQAFMSSLPLSDIDSDAETNGDEKSNPNTYGEQNPHIRDVIAFFICDNKRQDIQDSKMPIDPPKAQPEPAKKKSGVSKFFSKVASKLGMNANSEPEEPVPYLITSGEIDVNLLEDISQLLHDPDYQLPFTTRQGQTASLVDSKSSSSSSSCPELPLPVALLVAEYIVGDQEYQATAMRSLRNARRFKTAIFDSDYWSDECEGTDTWDDECEGTFSPEPSP